MKLLSTKKLKANQNDFLLGKGFTVADYNAIEIEFLDFEMPNEIENALFTSQNGVSSFIKSKKFKLSSIKNTFCVGEKTKTLLEKKGLNVIKTAKNSAELGAFIINNCNYQLFYYFCGTQRRDELPNILKSSKVDVFEVKTYKTILKPKEFDQKWDGILFFSPSGIESYLLKNNAGGANAFCIGETTANVARQYFNKVWVANTTSIESVIALAAKKLIS